MQPTIELPNTSFSSLGQFHQCRRSWYWGQELGLQPANKPVTGALPFGIRMHLALEYGVGQDGTDLTQIWQELVDKDRAAVVAAGYEEFGLEGLDKESKIGHVMLENYPAWLEESGFFGKWQVVGVEHQMDTVIPVDTPHGQVEVRVRGKADLVVRKIVDDSLWLLDYKSTSGLGESNLLGLALSPQPRVYTWLYEQQTGDRPRGVVYHLLRKVQQTRASKIPFYMEYEVSISPQDLDSYRTRLQGAVADEARVRAEIAAGADPMEVAYFSPGWHCSSCPFKNLCQLQNSYPAGAADMISNEFVTGDPFARYHTEDEDN